MGRRVGWVRHIHVTPGTTTAADARLPQQATPAEARAPLALKISSKESRARPQGQKSTGISNAARRQPMLFSLCLSGTITDIRCCVRTEDPAAPVDVLQHALGVRCRLRLRSTDTGGKEQQEK